MKAYLQSCSTEFSDLTSFYGGRLVNYEFIAPIQSKWTSDAKILVTIEGLDAPLFPEIDHQNDEFELELVIHRKPKAKTETQIFK